MAKPPVSAGRGPGERDHVVARCVGGQGLQRAGPTHRCGPCGGGRAIATAVHGAHLEVVTLAVGETGYIHSKDVAGVGPGIGEGAAGLAIAVVVAINAEGAVIRRRGPSQCDLTVA